VTVTVGPFGFLGWLLDKTPVASSLTHAPVEAVAVTVKIESSVTVTAAHGRAEAPGTSTSPRADRTRIGRIGDIRDLGFVAARQRPSSVNTV
jgi:hypothetical protein